MDKQHPQPFQQFQVVNPLSIPSDNRIFGVNQKNKQAENTVPDRDILEPEPDTARPIKPY